MIGEIFLFSLLFFGTPFCVNGICNLVAWLFKRVSFLNKFSYFLKYTNIGKFFAVFLVFLFLFITKIVMDWSGITFKDLFILIAYCYVVKIFCKT